jgi:Ca2+-transporting ATPase
MLLSVAAAMLPSLGFNQDFAQTRPEGEPPVDWVGGIVILIAILVIVLVRFLNDRQKEMQLRALDEKKDRVLKVIRDDEEQIIDIRNVVVGDIVLFEPGEVILRDGVFLSGHNVRCDRSGATGESGAIKELPSDGLQLLDSEGVAGPFPFKKIDS